MTARPPTHDPLPALGPIGFGAMHLSGDERPDRAVAVATLHAALDLGAAIVDTADAYCRNRSDTGHNEVLVAEALTSYPGDRHVVVATKGGHVRDEGGGWHVDGRPEHLVAAALASRERLRVERIELYQFHRPDPSVPFDESIGALADLLRDGVIAHAALSNVSAAQAQAAADLIPIATIQNELSIHDTSCLDVVEWCERHAVTFLAWAPLGGAHRAKGGGSGRTEVVESVAAGLGVSSQQVQLAWLRSLSPVVVPIPGARRIASVADSLGAARLELAPEAVDRLDAVIAPSLSRTWRPHPPES